MVYDPKRPRKPREQPNIETLKAWCQWKRIELLAAGIESEDMDLVKAIEDVIAQVNNYKSRYERELEKIKSLQAELSKKTYEVNHLKARVSSLWDGLLMLRKNLTDELFNKKGGS